MFAWLKKWWAKESGEPEVNPADDLAALLRDRRRLEETLGSYREFGFDALVPDLKAQIDALDRRVRELRGERQRAPAPLGVPSPRP